MERASKRQRTDLEAPWEYPFCSPSASISSDSLDVASFDIGSSRSTTPIWGFGDGDDTPYSFDDAFSVESLAAESMSDYVCFGMLVMTPSRVETMFDGIGVVSSAVCRTVTSDDDGRLWPETETYRSSCGEMSSLDTELIGLLRTENFELDMLLRCSPLSFGQTKNELFVVLYGPRDIGPDLGETLQDLCYFLQDPIFAQRDAPYSNPQRFVNVPNARTSDYTQHQQEQVREEAVQLVDVLAQFVSADSLPETAGSPYLLSELRSHQRRGLTFMLQREEGWQMHIPDGDVWSFDQDCEEQDSFINNVNGFSYPKRPTEFRGGILADQMGLGKTLSMISLIAHGKPESEADEHQTTLVVVPPSLINSWDDELCKHLSKEKFSWRKHHDKQRFKTPEEIERHDIVLTTYSTLVSEWRSKGRESLLLSYKWHRIVLDEAHCIKDPTTLTAQSAFALEAESRWVVTGTPIQNRISELASLFRFLQLDPYCNKKIFDDHITRPWKNGNEKMAVARLKKLLQFTMLRRPGTILNLPDRHDFREMLQFSATEQRAYDIAKQVAIRSVEAALEAEGRQDAFINALQKINALRVFCNHGTVTMPKSPKRGSPDPEKKPGEWDTAQAEVALRELSAAGLAVNCSSCLPTNQYYSDATAADTSRVVYVTRCLRVYCQMCYSDTLSNDPGAMFCNCGSNCPSVWATMDMSVDMSTAEAEDLDGQDGHESTKVQALVRDLSVWAPKAKCIVFSSWTTTLNHIQVALDRAKVPFVRIDGTVNNRKRSGIIKDFSGKEEARVLLMSLACGAVGLNLTVASRVYLMEPQWNPSIEEQAMARVYRLGQKREVTTVRYIMDKSIEKHVLDIQDNKKDLIELFFSTKPSTTQTKLSQLRDIRNLLR